MDKQIGFMMKHISVEQFAILSDNVPADDDVMELKTKYSFKLSTENKSIAPVVRFEFYSNSSLFMILEVLCAFMIKPEDWNGMIADNQIVIPQGFLAHIIMHTVGTARGILFCKTESTPFNQILLPAINVDEMVPENLSFPI